MRLTEERPINKPKKERHCTETFCKLGDEYLDTGEHYHMLLHEE